MVYESGFTTRRTYTSRPVVSSYTVSRKPPPIDWEKVPYVPRPSLISDPITAFGRSRPEREQRKRSILDPINRSAIKPDARILNEPIAPYIPARDKNRERILSMVRQHVDTVEAGGNTAARTSRDSLDTVLPRLHRAASESLPVRRETYRNEKSGAMTPRLDLCTSSPGQHRSRGSSDYSYSYKSNVEKTSYDSSNPYSRPERSSYSSTYENTSRNGPGGSYNYNTERTSTTGAGPGGYSYSSTTSGSLPGGTKYRHFSYHYQPVSRVSRVYKTSYPIYSSYTIRKPYLTSTRVIASPIRVVSSPTRIYSRVIRSPSPVRVTRTTTRIISSPERTTSYSYSSPLTTYYSSPSYLPSTYYTSSSSYVPSSYVYSTPSYVYSPISRIYTRSVTPVRVITSPARVTPSYLKRTPPGYGARQLTSYLNTEPFTTFSEETNRIRHRAQSLVRELHTPVIRRARSATPFPVGGYEPASQLALDAYVARVTNPIRHVAKEVHNMSHYAEPARKYVGKSHLASVRICGDRAYNIRRPMYDSDKVRNDINLMSWYLRQGGAKKSNKTEDNETVIKEVADLDPYRPSRKFGAPQTLDDPIGDETKEKQRLRQERLLTVNEEMVDEIELEKKKAQRQEEAKRKQQVALEEEVKRQAQEKEKKRLEEERKTQAAEAARKEEEARAAAEAERKEKEERAAAEAARKAEEEKAVAEAAQKAEEERLAAEAERKEEEERAAAAAAEPARREEEEKAAAEAARKEEEERAAAAAAEAALREEEEKATAEAARLAEEQRQCEEEMSRLAEIEKQAEEEREVELARQAAELAEMAAQELQAMQQAGKESDVDTNVTAMISTEPIIHEPPSPQPQDAAYEPTIELSTNADDNTGNAESLDIEEVDDEDEEEEEEEEE